MLPKELIAMQLKERHVHFQNVFNTHDIVRKTNVLQIHTTDWRKDKRTAGSVSGGHYSAEHSLVLLFVLVYGLASVKGTAS